MVLQTVVPPASPFSGNGDARWISNVGDFGGVVVVLFPIEQLECLHEIYKLQESCHYEPNNKKKKSCLSWLHPSSPPPPPPKKKKKK